MPPCCIFGKADGVDISLKDGALSKRCGNLPPMLARFGCFWSSKLGAGLVMFDNAGPVSVRPGPAGRAHSCVAAASLLW